MRLYFALSVGFVLVAAVMAEAAPGAKNASQTASKADPKVMAQAQRLARSARDDRSEAAGVEAQISHLRGQLVQLAAIEAAGERGTGGKRARLAALNAQAQALTARVGRSQNAASRLLGALALFRRDPPPALLVHPASARDAVRAQILARAMIPDLEARSRALAAQAQDLKRLRRQVEGASEDLFRSESELAEQRAQLETLMADRTALQRSLVADAETSEASLRALARKSRLPAELIGRLPPESESLGPAPDRFLEPVQGRIVARYGRSPSKDGPSDGFRWRTLPGAPVLSPAAGIVEYAGPLKDYGVILILRTGGAYHLVLAGLGAASAVAGRTVSAGEPIGRMADDAGPSPELYLEVRRRSGELVNPARWFKTAAG